MQRTSLTCLSRCSNCTRTSETLRCHPWLKQAAPVEPVPGLASLQCTWCTIHNTPAGWSDAASHSTAAAGNTNCNCSPSDRNQDTAGNRLRRTLYGLFRPGPVISGYAGRLDTRDPTCSDFAGRNSFRHHSSARDVCVPVDRRRSCNLLQLNTMLQKNATF